MRKVRSKSTSPPSRLAAGMVLVRFDSQRPLFLVLRAYRNWDFPKGMVEHDEFRLAAAKREVTEETGLTDFDFKWGYEHVDTQPYSGGKVARFFVAESKTQRITLSREHHEFRWLEYDEARALLHPRLKVIIDWASAKIKEQQQLTAVRRRV